MVHDRTQKGAIALQGNNERKWLRSMPDSIPASHDEIANVRKFLDQMPLWYICDFLFVRTCTGKMGIDTGAGHGYYVSLIDLTHRLQWYNSVHSPSTVRCSIIPGSSGGLEDKSIYS